MTDDQRTATGGAGAPRRSGRRTPAHRGLAHELAAVRSQHRVRCADSSSAWVAASAHVIGPEAVLHHADTAMYRAKREGGDRTVLMQAE